MLNDLVATRSLSGPKKKQNETTTTTIWWPLDRLSQFNVEQPNGYQVSKQEKKEKKIN